MDLLIAPNSVPLEKADKAPSSGVAQYATDGNPAQSILATTLPAYHYNSVMAEIRNAIIEGGLTPDRNNWKQLASIFKNYKDNFFTNTLFLQNDWRITATTYEGKDSAQPVLLISHKDTEGNWTNLNAIMLNNPDTGGKDSHVINATLVVNKDCQISGSLTTNGKVGLNNLTYLVGQTTFRKTSLPVFEGEVTFKEQIICEKGISGLPADFAECFQADKNTYIAGQVMMMGGDKEITLCTEPKKVFGVYSTQPGFVLNNHKDIENNIPIAMKGRVPVLIEGPVTREDRITPTHHGTAKASKDRSDIFIGRPIQDDLNAGTRLVECYVQAVI